MHIALWLLPLIVVFVTGDLVGTPQKRWVVLIVQNFEAAFGAYALSRNDEFLNPTFKMLNITDDNRKCARFMSQCGLMMRDQIDGEKCEGDDLSQGAVALLLHRMNVKQVRNVNNEFIKESYPDSSAVWTTKWDLSNGVNTMTCDVEFKLSNDLQNTERVSMMRLVCDKCKF